MVDRLVRGLALAAAFGLVPVGPAEAQQYSLTAEAGGDGDSNESLDDSTAEADFFATGATGFQSYHAQATAGGGLTASGQREGTPPFAAITLGATARIAETIKIGTAPFPTGPVAVTLGISGLTSVLAGPGLGAVRSSVQVLLDNGACSASKTVNSVTGVTAGGSCNYPDSGASGTSVTRVFTLQELSARGWKVNIEGQASVSFSDAQALANASALSSAGVWVQVSGGDATYSFHGTQTALPVPEPSAGLVGLTALAALGARAWRDRAPARARCRAPALR